MQNLTCLVISAAAMAFSAAAIAQAEQSSPKGFDALLESVESAIPVHLEQSAGTWTLLGPAYSHHWKKDGDTPADRKFTQRNPALGLQYSRDVEVLGYAGKGSAFAESVVDSMGSHSFLVGTSFQRQVSPADWPVKVLAGASLNLWYRTQNFDDNPKRGWVLFPMPVATIQTADGGLGLNLGFLPRVECGGHVVTPTTLMAQFTWTIK